MQVVHNYIGLVLWNGNLYDLVVVIVDDFRNPVSHGFEDCQPSRYTAEIVRFGLITGPDDVTEILALEGFSFVGNLKY